VLRGQGSRIPQGPVTGGHEGVSVTCCLTTLSVTRLYTVLNGRMIHKLSNEKDLKGSGRALIEILSRHLSGGTDNDHKKH
jgi:hypothetical protein